MKKQLKIIYNSKPNLYSTCLGFGFDVGSTLEEESKNGISHVLEHMVFKGSSKFDLYQIAANIEKNGNEINAYTSKEQTCFYITSNVDTYLNVLEILYDVCFFPTFPEEEFEKEKNVVLQELKTSLDDPSDVLYEKFMEVCFGSSPLGRNIIGTMQSLKNIKRDDVIDYAKEHYNLGNSVFSISGNFAQQDLESKFLELGIETKENTKHEVNYTNNKYKGGEILFNKKDMFQSYTMIGFEGVNASHEDIHALILFLNILGSGMSSRLFLNIRENLGLVYSIDTFNEAFKKNGVWGVDFICAKKNTSKIIELILKEIEDIKQNGVQKEELEKGKNLLLSSMYRSLDSAYSSFNKNINQFLTFGEIKDHKKEIEKIKNIKLEDVREVAKKYSVSKMSKATVCS